MALEIAFAEWISDGRDNARSNIKGEISSIGVETVMVAGWQMLFGKKVGASASAMPFTS